MKIILAIFCLLISVALSAQSPERSLVMWSSDSTATFDGPVTLLMTQKNAASLFVIEQGQLVDTLIFRNEVNDSLMQLGYCFCQHCYPSVFTSSLNLEPGQKIKFSKKVSLFATTPSKDVGANTEVQKEEAINQEETSVVPVSFSNLGTQEIKKGAVFQLDKIHFYGGSDQYLPESEIQLKELLDLMRKHPSLEISIEGHVNGLANDFDYYQRLSDARAIAVRNYLMDHGIMPNRLYTQGFGNTKMLFKQPTSEFQHQANRRVEVRILKV